MNPRRFGGKRGSRTESTYYCIWGFSEKKFSNARSLIFLQLGDSLSSFHKNNRVNVSGEKKVKQAFRGVCFFFFFFFFFKNKGLKCRP